MLFKIDENLPLGVTTLLRNCGHDALTVHDQQMVGELDPEIASVCQTEQRALVTLDLGFADIRSYPPADFFGIIVLRPRTHAKSAVLSLVNQILPLIETERLLGCLWIAQETGLRIREG